jgi:hypothetical protein
VFSHAVSLWPTFVPAQCVGRDCESSLRTIHEGVHQPTGWQKPMKPILASRIRVPLLDLLLFKCGRRLGVEIKRMDAPSLTGSMRIALANLQHAHLTVVYLGKQSL